MALRVEALGKCTPARPVKVEFGRVKALCEVLGDDNPLFTDWEVAHAGCYGSVIAPPTFINCFRSTKSELLIGQLGVDMTKLLHGEQEIHYYRPVRVGETVYEQIRIVEISEKQTKAFGPMEFFKVQITLCARDGTKLVEAYQSFFVRK